MTATAAPPLPEGETLLHAHVASLGAFQRSALVYLGLAVGVTALFAALGAPDYLVVGPVLLTLLVLLQERVALRRNGAWITNRRVIFQTGREVALSDIGPALPRRTGVLLGGRGGRLQYAADPGALARIINEARQT